MPHTGTSVSVWPFCAVPRSVPRHVWQLSLLALCPGFLASTSHSSRREDGALLHMPLPYPSITSTITNTFTTTLIHDTRPQKHGSMEELLKALDPAKYQVGLMPRALPGISHEL